MRAAPEGLKGKIGCLGKPKLGVEEAGVMRVLLDILATVLDLIAHELAHGTVGSHGVLDGHTLQNARLGIMVVDASCLGSISPRPL